MLRRARNHFFWWQIICIDISKGWCCKDFQLTMKGHLKVSAVFLGNSLLKVSIKDSLEIFFSHLHESSLQKTLLLNSCGSSIWMTLLNNKIFFKIFSQKWIKILWYILSTHKPPATLSLFSSELSMTAKEWCEYYWLMHHDVIVILIGNYDDSFYVLLCNSQQWLCHTVECWSWWLTA